jgi:hypothetical protein
MELKEKHMAFFFINTLKLNVFSFTNSKTEIAVSVGSSFSWKQFQLEG